MSSPDFRRSLRYSGLLMGLVVIAAAIQTRLPSGLEWRGVAPDLALAIAIAAGLHDGSMTGAAMGFLGAYLIAPQASLSPGSIYFSHILVGYLSGFPRARLYTENPLVPVAAGLAAGVLSETFFYLLTPRSPLLWIQGAAVQGLYLMALTPVIHALLHSLGRMMESGA
ncbi:MAG TPA: hypothetical protein VFJ58_09080 [Armatimonadota bacterium]|nr:hypothetical protein [Armatimonadota bacterium]